MSTTGWKIARDQRDRLLERFPPAWPDIIADHVTLISNATPGTTLPESVHAEIVGHISDDVGLQALVVALNGTTDRPDGGTFHITWSLDCARGRKPVESNEVISRLGWNPVTVPVPIDLRPAQIDHS
jgi:hypothetical protein